jgi:hypothetical protein
VITVSVEQTRGATTRRLRVSAPTIERALVLAGKDRPGTFVEVLFPIDAEAFFAPAGTAREGIDYEAMSAEEIEDAYEAGLPGAHDAWLDVLKDDLGEEAFEAYARENALA